MKKFSFTHFMASLILLTSLIGCGGEQSIGFTEDEDNHDTGGSGNSGNDNNDDSSNDTPSTPNTSRLSFSGTNSALQESAEDADLLVLINPPVDHTVTVSYKVSGTATANADYMMGSNMITIAPGKSYGIIPLSIADDGTDEQNETITITLTNPQGAELSKAASYTFTINDDDEPAVDARAAFGQTVYPLLREHCTACHAGAGPGNPAFSHPNRDTAYDQVVDTQKVDTTTPANSRLVQRLAKEFHNCWSDCAADAQKMTQVIEQWLQLVGTKKIVGSAARGVRSSTTSLAAGAGQGPRRVTDHLIARYDFSEATGNTARDTSGVTPAMDLKLTGAEWLAGQGIKLSGNNSMGLADKAASQKLLNQIAVGANASGEYTLEAWVLPENITQEGPARILSYSVKPDDSNTSLSQVGYNYIFRTRHDNGTDKNGNPFTKTADAAMAAKLNAQHLIVTYTKAQGRLIYVDANRISDADPTAGGALGGWNPESQFVVGNEVTGNRPWKGNIFYAAVYKRALTEDQIKQNFDAGYGRKTVLKFDVSDKLKEPNSYIQLEAREFDNFSYLFSKPTFVSATANDIRLRNLRIAVNDKASTSGQTFRNLDIRVNAGTTELSPLGAVIAKELGAEKDQFSLVFEVLGSKQDVFIESRPVPAPETVPAPRNTENGMKLYDQIYDTMAATTGVDPNNGNLRRIFGELRQQLPNSTEAQSFLGSHQVAISKLALEFCDLMTENQQARNNFFGTMPAFEFNAPVLTAFSDQGKKDLIINKVIERIIGNNVSFQPSQTELQGELNSLVNDLIQPCSTGMQCDAVRTRAIVKATCAAVLASAATTMQ
jgi:hypothetical protein